jgi:hypothetical protein
VAANQAYRAGDLDQARHLTEQAAALDPSRAGLWQQHRQEIAAQRLILSARAAHAEANHQRADRILADARQLDPRMRAIWDGALSTPPPARPPRQTHDHDTAAPGPHDTADTNRSTTQAANPQHAQPAATTQGDRRIPRQAWPSAPPRSEPGRPTPAAQQAGGTQPSAQRSTAAAAAREPRAHPGATAGDLEASTGPPDSDPARWPSPNPRSRPEATPPAQQAGHKAETGTGAATEKETRGNRGPGAPVEPTADWRDEMISTAREPWQPGPIQPYDPAVLRPPDAGSPDAGIEPGR